MKQDPRRRRDVPRLPGTLTEELHPGESVPHPVAEQPKVLQGAPMSLQEQHRWLGQRLPMEGAYSLKIKGWRIMCPSNASQMKSGVVILTSDKLKFIPKTVIRDEEGHYIILKGTIQEDLTIII